MPQPLPLASRLALGLACALALAGCGAAAVDALPDDPAFSARDLDGDGALSPEEAQLPSMIFSLRDRNGDGRLSRLEWRGPEVSPDNAWRQQVNQETERDHSQTRQAGTDG